MEEVVAAEAGVALAALRVEDPEGRPPPRRAVAVAGDQRLRPLADDVASEPDPRPPGELEAEAGRLGDGGRQAAGQARWLEHDEERLRAPGERRQPAEPVGDPGGLVRGGQPAAGQVEDEQVHRAPGQQRATDGQALVEGLRGDDHEPFEPDAAGDRLDRVEAARQVQPGHDRAGAWASAASRRTSVVRPLEPSPRIATLAERGRPPGPRIASSAANPVWMTRSSAAGSARGDGTGSGRDQAGAVAGARARAPSVIGAVASVAAVPAALGAAAPQRAWRLATAAVTSGERVAIGRLD